METSITDLIDETLTVTARARRDHGSDFSIIIAHITCSAVKEEIRRIRRTDPVRVRIAFDGGVEQMHPHLSTVKYGWHQLCY